MSHLIRGVRDTKKYVLGNEIDKIVDKYLASLDLKQIHANQVHKLIREAFREGYMRGSSKSLHFADLADMKQKYIVKMEGRLRTAIKKLKDIQKGKAVNELFL